jgi:hypothetical protein
VLISKLTKNSNKVELHPKNADNSIVHDMAVEKLKEAISLGELKLPELMKLLTKENSAEKQLAEQSTNNELPIGWKIVDYNS